MLPEDVAAACRALARTKFFDGDINRPSEVCKIDPESGCEIFFSNLSPMRFSRLVKFVYNLQFQLSNFITWTPGSQREDVEMPVLGFTPS